MSPGHESFDADGPREFTTTQWSVVLAAGHASETGAQSALANLYERYWFPLYAFLRREGCAIHDAQDLTQGFFATLLEKDSLRQVDRQLGRFRSFLLAALRHFVANERDRQQAQKRGGRQRLLSLDFTTAEGRLAAEPADTLSPELLFDRHWALAVLERVTAQLESELVAAGRGDWFASMKPLLVGESAAPNYAAVAAELGMTEGAVKTAVHRLRRRFRQLLKEEVAATVADPAEIDEELRDLISALRTK